MTTNYMTYAENILQSLGYEYSFIALSTANGTSIYFEVEGIKVRFSDHSVTNQSRMSNECHFYFNGTKSSKEQSILRLRFMLGDTTVKFGQFVDFTTTSGKVIKAFGYKAF